MADPLRGERQELGRHPGSLRSARRAGTGPGRPAPRRRLRTDPGPQEDLGDGVRHGERGAPRRRERRRVRQAGQGRGGQDHPFDAIGHPAAKTAPTRPPSECPCTTTRSVPRATVKTSRSSAAAFPGPDGVVIGQIESFGMAVGREVFETVRWAGRFEEAATRSRSSRCRVAQ